MSAAKKSSILRLLKPHARPYMWVLAGIMAVGTVSAMAQQAAFLLLSPTWKVLFSGERSHAQRERSGVDALFADWRETATSWVLGGTDPGTITDDQRMGLLVRVAVIVTLLAVVAGIAQYVFIHLSSWVGLKMIVGLRMRLARHLMGLSLRYHGRRHFGDLLSRISSDVTTTLGVVNIGLRDLIQEPLLAITALIGAFFVSPQATLIVVIGLPLLLVPISFLMRRIRKGSHKSLTHLGASVQALSQMFQGIRTVKAFRAEEREIERYQKINDSYVRATMKMVRAQGLSRTWTILYTHAGLGVLLLLVGYLTLKQGQVEGGGDMLVFFLLISKVYSSLKVSVRALGRVEEAAGACDRLEDLLDEEPDIVEQPGAQELGELGSGIRFEDVSFAYPDGDGNALDSISIEVQPGETLALVGPSGSGKSTFVDLVARFIDPTTGRVTVDGHDVRSLSFDSWAAHYAMVTQEPFLFHASIEENIRYGRAQATRAEIEEAARAANIHDFIAALPNGYATDVADAGTRLSGGQRQRITIARAFLRNAPLLLLDEATSALDTESEAVIQAALERLMENHTVIVIAHRLSTIRRADRIAVLEGGKLVELGTHDELLERGSVYARLHAAQESQPVLEVP